MSGHILQVVHGDKTAWNWSVNVTTDLLHLFENSCFYDCTFRTVNNKNGEMKVCVLVYTRMFVSFSMNSIHSGLCMPQADSVGRIRQDAVWALQRGTLRCWRAHFPARSRLGDFRVRHEVLIVRHICKLENISLIKYSSDSFSGREEDFGALNLAIDIYKFVDEMQIPSVICKRPTRFLRRLWRPRQPSQGIFSLRRAGQQWGIATNL